MKTWKSRILFIIVLVIAASIFASAYHSIMAQDNGTDETVMRKIDEVLTGQQEILAAIASLKEEMAIIKIRITQMQ